MLILVSGGPGTGKTHVVTQSLKFVQVQQLRMAFTARIAQNIGGKTLHSSLRLAWGPGTVLDQLEKKLENNDDLKECLDASSVLFDEFDCPESPRIVMIDEIAMIPYYLLYWVIRYFFDRTTHPVLVIGMGDGHQLLPVKSSHNLFGLACLESQFETHRIQLTESKRFFEEYVPVVERLRTFVDTADDTGLFSYVCATFPVVEEIGADVLQKCSRVLAFRNATVDNYNNYYVQNIMKGSIVRLYKWDSRKKEPVKESFVDVKPQCLIYVTQNGCSSATNGTLLVFQKYCPVQDAIECRKPTTGESVTVVRNRMGVFPIVLGFASTVHKYQGETIDDSAIAINFDGSRDLNLVYTALSRVRSMSQFLAIVL